MPINFHIIYNFKIPKKYACMALLSSYFYLLLYFNTDIWNTGKATNNVFNDHKKNHLHSFSNVMETLTKYIINLHFRDSETQMGDSV
jgi:hypothetical protein